MKWLNHRLIGFAVPFIITGDVWLSVASSVFSTIPDSIETLGGRPHRYKGLMKHRGASHHPITWIGIFFLAWAGYSSFVRPLIASLSLAKFGATVFTSFLWGVSLHLVCDLLTKNGLPLSFNGNRRASVSSLRTGSVTEYVIALALFSFSIWMRLGRKLL
ncbi:MAG: metal-dependent hydrolase [Thermodesulfovibrionales bacterium]